MADLVSPNPLFTSSVDSNTIKADLSGKILYDQPTVYKRLRVDEHATCLVTNCAELKVDYAFVEQASKKLPKQLEKEEKEDVTNDPDKDTKSGSAGTPESESDIYISIPDPYPEGAGFKCGGDVKFPLTGFPITVRNLKIAKTLHQQH